MSQCWITPSGSIANFLAGDPASFQLQSFDLTNTGATPSFTLIHGSLPTGLTLSPLGLISGTPVWPTINTSTTENYNFVVRMSSSDNTLTVDESGNINPDRAFTIILTNIVNGNFAWVTPAGSLGLVPNGEYYNLQLQAETVNGSSITYSFVSGELPAGMQLLSTGYLTGVPTFLNSITVDQNHTYNFTVRATNTLGQISDRAFSITVTNVSGPIIYPTTGNNTILNTVFDGTYFSQQLTVVESSVTIPVSWNIVDGQLPPGLTLDQNGLISGYIEPMQLVNTQWGPAGFDGDSLVNGTIVNQQNYDYGPFDFNQLNQSVNFSFTVEAFDGANYDTQKYTLLVVARTSWTADSLNPVNNTFLTVDEGNVYIPVLEDSISTLPIGRQGSHYAYKFQGHDFAGDTITYNIANVADTFDSGPFDPLFDNTYLNGHNPSNDFLPGSFDSFNPSLSAVSNLPGLLLDATTGWLYGNITPQASSFQTFNFGVVVSKTVANVVYTSVPKFFTLPVAGDINNVVTWVSSANLGTITNGSVSELSVVAHSPIGSQLIYTLVDKAGVPAKLPQGLELLPTGELSGRVSFEAFSLDDYTCTFDGGNMTIDRTYTFTVTASTLDGSASSTQTFTLTLAINDIKPYVNLYLEAMPAFDQRQIYNSIVSNTEIFNPNLIYRPNDPWFGVNKQIRMLFLTGLNAQDVLAYEQAIALNHWTKNYNFDSIKTAVVLDEFYNIKYELVYIDVIDPEENSAGLGAPISVDLSTQISNPYIANGITYPKVIYPNNSDNMITRLAQGVGYYDQSTLPSWMTSNQPDPAIPGKFSAPLGFTKAIVLAYTIPGASKLIAYRLRNSGINFNNVEFSVDRYQVDNYYTSNFNVSSGTFNLGKETTFDALPKNNVGALVAEVNYAVNIPFAEINGRPVSYINAAGGLDGITTFANGDTLIFAKQEQFVNAGPYDGWVDYTDAWIGDNVLTPGVEGYGGTNGFNGVYDTYNVIPGYLQSIQSTYTFTGNSTITTYQLSQTVSDVVAAKVYVNDVLQTVGSYILEPSQLIFNDPPPNLIVTSGVATITVYNGSNEQSFTSNGGISSFTLSSSLTGVTSVYVNQALQDPSTYTVSGTGPLTITFNTAPQPNYTSIPPAIKIVNPLSQNERGGVWKINIVNGVVNLTPLMSVPVNSRVQITNGKSYAGSILLYNSTLIPGLTVPYYSTTLTASQAITNPTTFNKGSTKFFSNRDQYYAPGTQDKYLKFPHYGVFN